MKIKGIKIEPRKVPEVFEIENEFKSYKELVGGDIEIICPFEDEDVALICNEDGKLIGLPLNRVLKDEKGKIFDVVCGTVAILGINEDYDFVDLPEDMITKYMEKFKRPEIILVENGEIIVL